MWANMSAQTCESRRKTSILALQSFCAASSKGNILDKESKTFGSEWQGITKTIHLLHTCTLYIICVCVCVCVRACVKNTPTHSIHMCSQWIVILRSVLTPFHGNMISIWSIGSSSSAENVRCGMFCIASSSSHQTNSILFCWTFIFIKNRRAHKCLKNIHY